MNRSDITFLENETILWEQSWKKNLLWPWYFIPAISIVVDLIILYAIIALIIIGLIWASLFLMFIIVLTTCLLIWINISHNGKRRKKLELSNDELKNYQFFDILTNQRYIRRNYYFNFQRSYSSYPKDAYEILDDVFFLNLRYVKRVLFFFRNSTIGLELEGFEEEKDFPIGFNKDRLSEFPKVRNALINTMNLEFIEGELGHVEIYHSRNPVKRHRITTRIRFIKVNREVYGPQRKPPKWTFPEVRKVHIVCSGSGSIQDPIVVDNFLHLPKRVTIRDYNLHFTFKNLSLRKLLIDGCENFSFFNCEIDCLRLISCSNIKFVGCRIPRDFRLKECDNINFKKCLVRDSIVFKSNGIVIEDCVVIQLTDWMSKNNVFKSNKIKKLRTNTKQETFDERNILSKNDIKKLQFRLKELFPTGPKVLIKSKYFWITVTYIVPNFIGFFLIIDLNSKGYDIGYWDEVYPGLFFGYIPLIFIMAIIEEFYHKFKFKIMRST